MRRMAFAADARTLGSESSSRAFEERQIAVLAPARQGRGELVALTLIDAWAVLDEGRPPMVAAVLGCVHESGARQVGAGQGVRRFVAGGLVELRPGFGRDFREFEDDVGCLGSHDGLGGAE